MNWLFGDNINTDLITPGRYNITTDPAQLAKIAFIEHRPEFAQQVKSGDFIVAGKNFGCGSSRETAVTALSFSGIRAVVAQSFARIFYRNCMNQGLLAVIADTRGIRETDALQLDFAAGELMNVTRNRRLKATMPPLMLKLHQEGGIIAYIQKHGLSAIDGLFSP